VLVHHCTLFHLAGRPLAISYREVVVFRTGLGSAMPEHLDSVEGEGDGEQDAAFSQIVKALGHESRKTHKLITERASAVYRVAEIGSVQRLTMSRL
jgi:hypothetical protein